MRSNRTDNPTRFTGRPTRALALIAAIALVALSLGAGLAMANSGRPHVQAQNTFTKWITATPNLPGEVKDMGGVVGGDVGDGAFAGTVLSGTPVTGGMVLNAIYGFNGSEHAFKALMHIVQTGTHAVLIGVVTDGWMQGHLVEGEYTMGACTGDLAAHGTCFSGTLDIMQAFKP
jgi:hypothetical protein